jgi:uncharacterized protein
MDKLTRWQGRFERRLETLPVARDGAHDIGHCRRVWQLAKRIAADADQDVDPLVLLAAAYFHDVVSVTKNHPQRSNASRLAARKARAILTGLRFPADRLGAVTHAIEAHSHSAGIKPRTSEARILQDADRMEALGAIGVARLFYMAGQMKTKLFHDTDPAGQRRRRLNDQRYALDHYYKKLRHLSDRMNTSSARAMARNRANLLTGFVEALVAEALQVRLD